MTTKILKHFDAFVSSTFLFFLQALTTRNPRVTCRLGSLESHPTSQKSLHLFQVQSRKISHTATVAVSTFTFLSSISCFFFLFFLFFFLDFFLFLFSFTPLRPGGSTLPACCLTSALSDCHKNHQRFKGFSLSFGFLDVRPKGCFYFTIPRIAVRVLVGLK